MQKNLFYWNVEFPSDNKSWHVHSEMILFQLGQKAAILGVNKNYFPLFLFFFLSFLFPSSNLCKNGIHLLF